MKRYEVRQVAWDVADITFEALIEIDDLGQPVQLWNGWLCPLLGTAEVQRLIDWQNKALGEGAEIDGLGWDQDDDVVYLTVTPHPVEGENESERLEPVIIAGAAFYTPGSWSWTWTFADEGDE